MISFERMLVQGEGYEVPLFPVGLSVSFMSCYSVCSRRYLGFWCGSVRSGVTVTLCGLVSVEGGMVAVRFRACVLATKYEG